MEDRFIIDREQVCSRLKDRLCASGLFLRGSLSVAEADGLADAIAQVIQLRTARHATALDVDLGDLRRVQRELSLDAFARDDPTDGEHLAAAAARATDDGATEDLNSLILAFENSRMHIDGVANRDFWRLGLQARFFDQYQNVLAHGNASSDWMLLSSSK